MSFPEFLRCTAQVKCEKWQFFPFIRMNPTKCILKQLVHDPFHDMMHDREIFYSPYVVFLPPLAVLLIANLECQIGYNAMNMTIHEILHNFGPTYIQFCFYSI